MNESGKNSISISAYADIKKSIKFISIILIIIASAITVYFLAESLRKEYNAKNMLNQAIDTSKKTKSIIFHRKILGKERNLIAKPIEGTENFLLISKDGSYSLFRVGLNNDLYHISGSACDYADLSILNNRVNEIICNGDRYIKNTLATGK